MFVEGDSLTRMDRNGGGANLGKLVLSEWELRVVFRRPSPMLFAEFDL
jgi:hypothetical protein